MPETYFTMPFATASMAPSTASPVTFLLTTLLYLLLIKSPKHRLTFITGILSRILLLSFANDKFHTTPAHLSSPQAKAPILLLFSLTPRIDPSLVILSFHRRVLLTRLPTPKLRKSPATRNILTTPSTTRTLKMSSFPWLRSALATSIPPSLALLTPFSRAALTLLYRPALKWTSFTRLHIPLHI